MLYITICQFQIFEAVSQHLSYTRAAELLYQSQPAVSIFNHKITEFIN
ncbi:MAG: LysR family transcriptional regulator [Piscirickettsiaceae bacterium]|nr:LysR family transcriptional regulator [Piscirickettsiaceae bacterium]